jgi:hypothetical protein
MRERLGSASAARCEIDAGSGAARRGAVPHDWCCAFRTIAASEAMRMIRLLLAEDQAMVRGALAALLRLETDIDRALRSRPTARPRGASCSGSRPTCWSPTSRCRGLTGLELAQRIQRHGLPTRW